MSRIRVLHLVASFDTGGLQNGIVTLLNHGDAARFDHLILSMSPATDMANRLKRGDVRTLDVPMGEGANLGSRIAEIAGAFGAHVLHSRNWPTLVDGWRARRRVPGLIQVHGHHGRDADTARGFGWKRALAGRLITRGLSRVITLTRSMAQEYEAVFGRARGGVSLIPNGVVIPPAAAPPRRSGEPFHILAVGRLATVKDYPALIEAFALMEGRGPDDRLTIVGSGPEEDHLRSLVAQHGLEGAVEMPGAVHPVAPLYTRAHAFVQSSVYEGMSNTIAEAMAAGLPVVATHRGGNPDVVADAGVLVPGEDAVALGAALSALRADPERAGNLGKAARHRATEEFSVAAMVGRYEEVWTQMAEKKR